MNYQENLQHVSIDTLVSGDNTIIAAPGDGHYLAIDFLQVFVPAAVGVTFKHGTTAFNGKYSFQSGQNVTIENSMKNEHGVLTCGNNEAFVLNLDAALQCSGFMRYRIVGN